MKKYINILKSVAWYILGFVGICFLLSVLYYFTNISLNVISTLLLIMMIICFFATGFIGGRKCDSKGFIYGLKCGGIFVIVMYLLGGILFSFSLNLYKIIYYLILILASTLGSMFGINTKK